MKKHNKKAFTLVELLVVIAIIAILAVVSIVGYTAFTKKAKESVAQQELAQVVTLITGEEYTNDALTFDGEGQLTYEYTVEAESDTSLSYTLKTINKEWFGAQFPDLKDDLNALKGELSVTTENGTVSATAAGSGSEYTITVKVTIKALTYTTADEGATCVYSFADKTYTNVKPV